MIGAGCFAVASIPMLSDAVQDDIIGTKYFVGSLFFTTASVLVAPTTWRDVSGTLSASDRRLSDRVVVDALEIGLGGVVDDHLLGVGSSREMSEPCLLTATMIRRTRPSRGARPSRAPWP
jgi:hypothetical protein